MSEAAYQQSEKNPDEIKIILKYSKQQKDNEAIRQEVKSILVSILQEYLRTCSSTEQIP